MRAPEKNKWGRRPAMGTGKAAFMGKASTDAPMESAGVLGAACRKRGTGNQGRPVSGEVRPRRRLQGRRPERESERVVVPLKPGNSGGGKGPYFGCAFEEGKGRRLAKSLQTPEKIRTLQRKLYAKAKAEPAFRFYILYDKIHRAGIAHAYEPSHENAGARGVDGQV